MSKLRKIARILLLIGGILSLVFVMTGAVFLGVAAIVVPMILTSENVNVIPEQFAAIAKFGGIGLGLVLIFVAIFALVAGVLGIQGFKKHEKGNYIGNIVFDVLSGFQIIPLVGAVLGLIALKKDAKNAPAQPKEEAEEEAEEEFNY